MKYLLQTLQEQFTIDLALSSIYSHVVFLRLYYETGNVGGYRPGRRSEVLYYVTVPESQ